MYSEATRLVTILQNLFDTQSQTCNSTEQPHSNHFINYHCTFIPSTAIKCSESKSCWVCNEAACGLTEKKMVRMRLPLTCNISTFYMLQIKQVISQPVVCLIVCKRLMIVCLLTNQEQEYDYKSNSSRHNMHITMSALCTWTTNLRKMHVNVLQKLHSVSSAKKLHLMFMPHTQKTTFAFSHIRSNG